MRVLVCGGRDFCDWGLLCNTLSDIKSETPISCIIQGDAKGADWLAKAWASWFNIPTEDYPADWGKHKKAAGPIRNQKMIDEGKPGLVVAFPGGAGTADMVRRAKKHNIKVIEVKDG